MIEQIGLDYIIGSLVVAIVFVGYQMDRFSRHSLRHIDNLQDRVAALEKKIGAQTEIDMNSNEVIRNER
ncbi:hypothetical protein [uncultured Pseudoteredinibacter sp.]|uniref:hypothetical protein n=1 Tax=uncultured Pseudoteredinibacter sp. TaxID=1641701 RepID=UPI0026177ED6|nr:hypothetical protein [uncultured Pseudoteredinibacter sp.]